MKADETAGCRIIGFYKATSKEFVMKLRMTGFECHRIFVIRLYPKITLERVGPAIETTAGLGISYKFDEFPNIL